MTNDHSVRSPSTDGNGMREALESARLDFHNGLDKLDRTIAEANPPAAPVALRRIVLDALNEVAPAVENLATHQEQCDFDGVMVKVSRQALYEVLNAINEVAIQAAITSPAPVDAGGREALEICRSIAEENKLHWARLCDPCNPNDPSKAIYRAKSAACFQVEMDIAALSSQPVVGVEK